MLRSTFVRRTLRELLDKSTHEESARAFHDLTGRAATVIVFLLLLEVVVMLPMHTAQAAEPACWSTKQQAKCYTLHATRHTPHAASATLAQVVDPAFWSTTRPFLGLRRTLGMAATWLRCASVEYLWWVIGG